LFELTDDEISAAERNQPWYEYSHAIARAQLAKVARMLPELALSKVILTDIMAREIMADKKNALKTVQTIARMAAWQQLEAVRKALEEEI